VLSLLAGSVIAIEMIPELAEMARRNLERTGYLDNVTVIQGDGSQGWPAAAPYNAISVAAAAPEIPWQLLDQLADPGRLVIPVGTREDQDLKVVTKENGQISTRIATFCRFVPLLGAQGWSR
jgi:protein-L-isoaspartate(D-aspartate) O-methyltransferase